jgi:DNA-binding transcriptional MerR regulator
VDVDRLLTVGEVARRSGLTAKALRHYDRVGLLTPAEVDATTGYRRYRSDQVGIATLVRVLRDLGVPLDQIKSLGPAPQAAAVADLLRAHRVQLEAELTDVQLKLHGTDQVIAKGWQSMAARASSADVLDEETERTLAKGLFNDVWALLEKPGRSPDDDARMTHMAHASCLHWSRVGSAANFVRGEWQCSRVYATLRRFEPALHHAKRALEICEASRLADFDLAFCYEAMARAYAVGGDAEEAKLWADRAREVPIAEDDDRELLTSDVDSIVELR